MRYSERQEELMSDQHEQLGRDTAPLLAELLETPVGRRSGLRAGLIDHRPQAGGIPNVGDPS